MSVRIGSRTETLRGETGHQLYKQFGDGKLGGVNLQGMPADEAQRAGDDGFGEGNFKALFESLERDQIERGALNVENRQ